MIPLGIGVVNTKVNPSGRWETPGRVIVAQGQSFRAPGWITTPMPLGIQVNNDSMIFKSFRIV